MKLPRRLPPLEGSIRLDIKNMVAARSKYKPLKHMKIDLQKNEVYQRANS